MKHGETCSRSLLLALVLGAHVSAILLWPTHVRRDIGKPEAPASFTSLLANISKEVTHPAELVRRRENRHSNSQRRASNPPEKEPTSSNAITPPRPAIDWRKEGNSAASRAIAAAGEEHRRNAAFSRQNKQDEPSPPRDGPEFGWAHGRVHPVEELPEGGLLIHLSERCVLVLSTLLIPVCQFGKTPPRGDLFEHMRDVPQSSVTDH
jgi:hypothetical protein